MTDKTEKKAAKAPPPPRTSKVQFASAMVAAPPSLEDQVQETPAAARLPDLPVEKASAPSARYADLNFKVPERFKRRYRQAAGVMGLKLNQVLQESFELWLQKNDLHDLRLPGSIDIGDEK